MFRHNSDANINGTYFLDEIELPPAYLLARFGTPEPGDGYRCTGSWSFVSDLGEVFTVYEYKSTKEWLGEQERALSASEFWTSWTPAVLSIGGHEGSNVEVFRQWLMSDDQVLDKRNNRCVP